MNQAWTLAAACRDVSTTTANRFFSDSLPEQRKVIRDYCGPCPVVEECREAAIAEEPSIAYGIRGGLTGHERTVLRRAQSREPAAA